MIDEKTFQTCLEFSQIFVFIVELAL